MAREGLHLFLRLSTGPVLQLYWCRLADQHKSAASSVVEHSETDPHHHHHHHHHGMFHQFDATPNARSLAAAAAAAAGGVNGPHRRRLRSDSSLTMQSVNSAWTQQPF